MGPLDQLPFLLLKPPATPVETAVTVMLSLQHVMKADWTVVAACHLTCTGLLAESLHELSQGVTRWQHRDCSRPRAQQRASAFLSASNSPRPKHTQLWKLELHFADYMTNWEIWQIPEIFVNYSGHLKTPALLEGGGFLLKEPFLASKPNLIFPGAGYIKENLLPRKKLFFHTVFFVCSER